MRLQNLRIRIAGWLLGTTVHATPPIMPLTASAVAHYFITCEGAAGLETLAHIRDVLIERKLIRKDRSDKGTKRKAAND